MICVFPVITETPLFQEKVHPISNVRSILKTRSILNIPFSPWLPVQDIKCRQALMGWIMTFDLPEDEQPKNAQYEVILL